MTDDPTLQTLFVPTSERIISFLSFAALCGFIAGVVSSRFRLPSWTAVLGGFGLAWYACKCLLPMSHDIAGWMIHRFYDITAALAGYLAVRELEDGY